MSWLSSATGIHISPKGVKIEPLKALGTIATAGLLPGAGSMLGGLVSKIPGVASIGGALSGVAHAAQGIPGVSAIGGALKGVAGKLLPGVEGAIGGALDHPLDTLGGINSAMDAAHARDLQGKAEGLAMDNYNQRAPLRAAGVAGLLKPAVPDLSGVNYGSAGSVYGKRKGV